MPRPELPDPEQLGNLGPIGRICIDFIAHELQLAERQQGEKRANLPGFYFDSEKNRYFPLSHQKKARARESADALSTSYEDEGQHTHHGQPRSKLLRTNITPVDGVLTLVHQRELSGNGRYGQSRSRMKAFQGEYLELHTIQPRVRKYGMTSNSADGGLEQLRFSLQTEEGEVEADMMTVGGTAGRLGLLQITKPGDQGCEAPVFPAAPCLPVNPDVLRSDERDAPGLRRSKSILLTSKITSIKRLNDWLDRDRVEEGKGLRQQRVIVTTLGDGAKGGTLHLLQQDMHGTLSFQLLTILCTGQSVWTSESNHHRKSASLGMSSGAATVDLERGAMSWLCRSSSDVLSQQFDSTGDIVLCGFRNGVISTIDLRLPQPLSCISNASDINTNSSSTVSRKWLRIPGRSDDGRWLPQSFKKSQAGPHYAGKGKGKLRAIDKSYCSHSTIMQMSSAICSLALLRSSEWYLLASAMNGDIQQWDRRFVGKGPLRSYEGHVNTHTTLQLGVDPTERLLVSGGEDSAVRLWSLASGRLLVEMKGLPSPVTTLTWPTSVWTSDCGRWGGFWKESPFEEDNVLALWMGSSSGLLHMRGAAK